MIVVWMRVVLILCSIFSVMGCKPQTAVEVELSSELERACYGFPEQQFSRRNRVGRKPFTGLNTGDKAVEFTLKDTDGNSHTLSDLLVDKPVLLVTGSRTCPKFRGNQSAIEATAKTYKDQLHTVMVYTIDPHPVGEASPYIGRVRTHRYSDCSQAKDYDTRVELARSIKADNGILTLVDAIDNPFWCTYGPCSNCAFIIDRTGKIEAVRTWYKDAAIRTALDTMLNK